MTEHGASTPRVIARPPLLYLGALVVGIGADALWPVPSLAGPAVLSAGLALILAGVALGVLAARRMRAASTNIPTNRPSLALVTVGPYARSRNPIYLAMTALYVGIGLVVGSPSTLILLVPLLMVMRYGVIAREERYLEERFGEPYRAYSSRVRRWI